MPIDITSLLCAHVISLVTMALALPAVMGRVGPPARRAQFGVLLQAAGWALLLASGLPPAGGWGDRLLSSLAMACISGSVALMATAYDLWCGRAAHDRWHAVVVVAMPLVYLLGFESYPFRVGWANGVLALQMLLMALTLGRTPALPVGNWRWLVIASLLAQVLVTAWRGVLGAFFTEAYPTFLSAHPVNIAAAMVVNATCLLSIVGILLAHRDEAARALERLATVDGLTGVLNRRAWLDGATAELAARQRYAEPVAVLMIDLDHFKAINDHRGHEAGDGALRFAARQLQAAARAGDLVGRYGGEEFCVLMNHADEEAAHAFDRRLRARLAGESERELGFALEYSAGIALRTGPDDTLEAMLRRADATLYRAKGEGRARTLQEPPLQWRPRPA